MLPLNICSVGLGYVGLPTAILLADYGHNVHGYDINQTLVADLQKGHSPVAEKDFQVVFDSIIATESIRFADKPAKADVFIISVPTPLLEDKKPDLSYIMQAVDDIMPLLEPGNLVILESTSPVGTTDALKDAVIRHRPDLVAPDGKCGIFFAYCPERVLPGNTVYELTTNDRLIGGLCTEACTRARAVFESFCKGEMILCEARAAEMVKLAENSFRDVNIAFANELAGLCESYSLDVHDIIAMANRHPRVNILSPGVGVGGHCIPVDPWFIVADRSEQAALIKQARLVNDATPERMALKAREILSNTGLAKVLVLGLAYKPNVGDFRESPSLELVKRLQEYKEYEILVHDPFWDISFNIKGVRQITFEDIAAFIPDCLTILATGHDIYKELSFQQAGACLDPSDFLT